MSNREISLIISLQNRVTAEWNKMSSGVQYRATLCTHVHLRSLLRSHAEAILNSTGRVLTIMNLFTTLKPSRNPIGGLSIRPVRAVDFFSQLAPASSRFVGVVVSYGATGRAGAFVCSVQKSIGGCHALHLFAAVLLFFFSSPTVLLSTPAGNTNLLPHDAAVVRAEIRMGASNGTPERNGGKMKTISAQSIEEYRNGKSADQLGRELHLAPSTIRRRLVEHGVQLRKLSEAKKRYTLNESAFNELTPEAAYWIGFLFADGYIGGTKRMNANPQLRIELKSTDVAQVEKLKTFLHSGHKIQFVSVPPRRLGGKPTQSVRLFISGSHLITKLQELGMSALKPERMISDALAYSKDFWRGVIDGDGHIGLVANRPVFQICGWLPLLKQCQSFLAHISSSRASIKPMRKIHRIATTCNPAVEIITALYGGTDLALERKLAIAQTIMGHA